MQVSGRIVILTALGIAVALSGGAWWYHYQATRQAAKFWGPTGVRLLVKSPSLELLELGAPATSDDAQQTLARQAIVASHDLSRKPGLIHLRFVFTQDAYFHWSERQREKVGGGSIWEYALRFTDEKSTMVVLLRRDFHEIGKLDGDQVDVLPSPRIASSVRQYLTEIGVLKAKSPDR
jgi:hypothetical protein